jgi:hypothetical protein
MNKPAPSQTKKPQQKAIVTREAAPAPAVQVDINPQALIAAAIEKNVPIEMMEKLLSMRERLRAEAAEMAYREAMAKFQSECPIIPKRKEVFDRQGKLRYRYAPIDDIISTVKPSISKYGFSYTTKTEQVETPRPGIQATVIISHVAGHSEQSAFFAEINVEAYMTQPQKWASASTFAKRYAFCNGFGIMTGDDDNDANETEDEQKEDQAEKAKQAAIDRLVSLPDNVKKGFEILGYKVKAAWSFCEARSWNHEKIMADINKIVDGQK